MPWFEQKQARMFFLFCIYEIGLNSIKQEFRVQIRSFAQRRSMYINSEIQKERDEKLEEECVWNYKHNNNGSLSLLRFLSSIGYKGYSARTLEGIESYLGHKLPIIPVCFWNSLYNEIVREWREYYRFKEINPFNCTPSERQFSKIAKDYFSIDTDSRIHLTPFNTLVRSYEKDENVDDLKVMIAAYVPDFILWGVSISIEGKNYIPVFEIDGKVHNTPIKRKKDMIKDDTLRKLGFWVLRFDNDQVRYNKNYVREVLSSSRFVKEFKYKTDQLETLRGIAKLKTIASVVSIDSLEKRLELALGEVYPIWRIIEYYREVVKKSPIKTECSIDNVRTWNYSHKVARKLSRV